MREHFPILSRTTYLVSNSLGAMPDTVPAQLATYAREWQERGVRAWADGWWTLPVTVGDVVAPLLGAQAGEVAMLPTVTQAMTRVLTAVPLTAPRNRIVMTALDFPSVRYAYEGLAPRLGGEVVVVPSDDGIGIELDRLLAAIDERTALVAISHVLFKSAYIIDAAKVIEKAHAVGAVVALDAYHSVGVMPVEVHTLGVDFLCGGVLKWLCGGPGGAFLYASPTANERFAPAYTGWQAHAQPFAFDPAMAYAGGAWRWLEGTPAVPALFAAIEGPSLVRQFGLARVRAQSTRQTARLIELADARGWTVNAPRDAERRGGTVAIDVPHAASVAQTLLARDVVIDYRPGAGIRIAPHFYTLDDEIERAVAEIDDILATGAWQSFADRRPVVT